MGGREREEGSYDKREGKGVITPTTSMATTRQYRETTLFPAHNVHLISEVEMKKGGCVTSQISTKDVLLIERQPLSAQHSELQIIRRVITRIVYFSSTYSQKYHLLLLS